MLTINKSDKNLHQMNKTDPNVAVQEFLTAYHATCLRVAGTPLPKCNQRGYLPMISVPYRGIVITARVALTAHYAEEVAGLFAFTLGQYMQLDKAEALAQLRKLVSALVPQLLDTLPE